MAQANPFKKSLGPFATDGFRQPEQLGVIVERLGRSQEPVQIRFLRQETDSTFRSDIPGTGAQYLHLARCGEQQPEQDLDGGGLAGSVRSQQTEDLAATDLHGGGGN